MARESDILNRLPFIATSFVHDLQSGHHSCAAVEPIRTRAVVHITLALRAT
jgi:hypothetical protein